MWDFLLLVKFYSLLLVYIDFSISSLIILGKGLCFLKFAYFCQTSKHIGINLIIDILYKFIWYLMIHYIFDDYNAQFHYYSSLQLLLLKSVAMAVVFSGSQNFISFIFSIFFIFLLWSLNFFLSIIWNVGSSHFWSSLINRDTFHLVSFYFYCCSSLFLLWCM